MTIMITGGTGFIGAHLARRLLHAGEQVVLFDTQPERQAIQDIAEHVNVVRGDASVGNTSPAAITWRSFGRLSGSTAPT